MLVGIIWTLQNPIVVVLTIVAAIVVFVILKMFLPTKQQRWASRNNRRELRRIRQRR